jgi:hypothetical protein
MREETSMEKAASQQISVKESVELTAPAVRSGVPAPPASETTLEEAKLIRRLQMMMNMVMQVIAQDASLTVEDASQMIADARTAALAMFPGKELAYDLIWRPRFQRLMQERFRLM